ncbi:MAG TPA: hypothetical protein VGE89_11800 [Bryobacteraceae bacterium]
MGQNKHRRQETAGPYGGLRFLVTPAVFAAGVFESHVEKNLTARR